MDMDQLSDDQLNKLRQFQDIANLDDIELAIVSLASCDWNLEHAIEAHLGGNPPVARAQPVGISPEDYVHDFPMDDDDMQMMDAVHGVLRPRPEMAQGPGARVARTFGHAAARPASAELEEMMARIASSSSSTSSASVVPTRGGAAEERETAGRSARSTAAAAAVDSDDEEPVVVAPRQPAAPAAPRAAAQPARMDYSTDSDNDDDYDYAMEEQDEVEPEPARPPITASNGSGTGSRTHCVPLIPTDCASAIEGTQNFQSVFEARYGKNGRGHLMPPFFIGTLQSAIREAFDCPDRPVSERRPLALYIHHDRSIACNIFPQAVLCADQVLQLLRSQFIVWPWDVTAKENQDKLTTWLSECSLYDARPIVASFLANVDRFPLLILLSKDGSQLRMVDFVTGSEGAESAMEKLLMCMDAYATSKISLEKQEQQRAEREALRKEQERELQESLAVDRERAERQAREIREAKEAEEKAVREKEEREAYIAMLKSSLPAEPEEGTPGCYSFRFRFPEARTAARRFSSSDPFSALIQYLESEGFPAKDYRFMNSDFPQKKDISEWDKSKALADLKFPARGEVINVEER